MCPTRIPVASRDEKGFELLVGMKIHKKGQKITGSLTSEKAYLLTPDIDITENTRYKIILKFVSFNMHIHYKLQS